MMPFTLFFPSLFLLFFRFYLSLIDFNFEARLHNYAVKSTSNNSSIDSSKT